MSGVFIGDLNKVILLHALWMNSPVAAFFKMNGVPAPSFDESQAQDAVKTDYIDYFCGRVIKSDLSGTHVNPRLYDRDNGSGSFERIVNMVRNNNH